jgi:hypothetical protein
MSFLARADISSDVETNNFCKREQLLSFHQQILDMSILNCMNSYERKFRSACHKAKQNSRIITCMLMQSITVTELAAAFLYKMSHNLKIRISCPLILHTV